MSGFQAAIARMGAIERLVAVVRPPAIASASVVGPSFAETLAQVAGVSDPAPVTVATTSAGAPGPTIARAAASPIPAALLPSPGAPPGAAPVTEAAPVERRTAADDVPDVPDTYRPAHVTQTDERVWNDCTWASAAMWIDKLTGGAVRVDRERLRAASGDTTGGSSLGDVVRGARRLLDLDLWEAHAEGLTMTGLLDRLAAGGGAIVQGSYASLPANLTRHDPGFAAKGPAGSGHAVYVGPLDRATGRVWWDDPLAPAGGSGEWISVADLRRFAWTDERGRVYAMATPAGTGGDPAGATVAATGAVAAPIGSPDRSAAAIFAAAWTAGVDPLLLTAYLDARGTAPDEAAATRGAVELAAALATHGRADRALEHLGSAARSGGPAFAADVLRGWRNLLEARTSG